MYTRLRRRLHAVRPGGEDGMTLPELMVSITIMAMVSAALIASVVAVNRSLGVANATMNDVNAARIGIERVGQLLRGAVSLDGDLGRTDTALIRAGGNDITFLTFTGVNRIANELGNPALACTTQCNPLQFRLFVNANGELVEQKFYPTPVLRSQLAPGATPTYSATPSSQRVILRDVQPLDPQGNPYSIFRYWTHYWDSGSGAPASDRCGVEILPSGAWISAARDQDVDSISFTLVVREPNGYDNAAVELRGWARFASAEDLGFSGSFDSAGCLDNASGGFGYDL